MSAEVQRVVALGASNLTRGFGTLVSASRAAWGPRVEVLAALGHGRSYGSRSTVLIRTLPGILDCGIWRELEARPKARTRALVTDVGNDILYGASAEQILTWVGESVRRLASCTDDLVITGLPLGSVRRLSNWKYLVVRSAIFPACRLALSEVVSRAERVDAGLAELASRQGARFLHLRPEWYGFDPIHVRPALWGPAWREILGCPPEVAGEQRPALEGARLYLLRPERRWLLGVEQVEPQTGVELPGGARVWLY